MPERSKSFTKKSSNAFSKLKWLEEIKSYDSLRKGTLKHEVEEDPRPPRKRRSSKIKNVEMTLPLPGEW